MTRSGPGRRLAAGLITAVALWSSGGGAHALAAPTLYTYDELGRLKTVTKTTGLRVMLCAPPDARLSVPETP